MRPGVPVRRQLKPFYRADSVLATPLSRDAVNQNYKKNQVDNSNLYQLILAVRNLEDMFDKLRRRVIGGAAQQTGGWRFHSPIELPDPPYPAFDNSFNWIIHIQPNHPIVTSGIMDAGNPTGYAVYSVPGFWVSLQAVPAQQNINGIPAWNLPQLPLPNPDNLDDPKNFWMFFPDINCLT
jgi:hypothetical protein